MCTFLNVLSELCHCLALLVGADHLWPIALGQWVAPAWAVSLGIRVGSGIWSSPPSLHVFGWSGMSLCLMALPKIMLGIWLLAWVCLGPAWALLTLGLPGELASCTGGMFALPCLGEGFRGGHGEPGTLGHVPGFGAPRPVGTGAYVPADGLTSVSVQIPIYLIFLCYWKLHNIWI